MLYPTSLSECTWQLLQPIFESYGVLDKGRIHSVRTITEAILYVVDNGTKWRNLPNDFPPWKTVYHYFTQWSHSSLWAKINLVLVESVRFAAGRDESPSLASIDSQSQDAEPGIVGRGLDGNKKRNGRKRHVAVDSGGLVLGVICTPANESDVHAGQQLAAYLNDVSLFPRMAKILGDNAYSGVGATLPVPISVEASERKPGQKGFVPEAFRWAVERTFAWLNRQRRIARNYEKKSVHQESMNLIANIRLCLKRLTKWI
jgi:putative transposase